jgi:hypothetical protein
VDDLVLWDPILNGARDLAELAPATVPSITSWLSSTGP